MKIRLWREHELLSKLVNFHRILSGDFWNNFGWKLGYTVRWWCAAHTAEAICTVQEHPNWDEKRARLKWIVSETLRVPNLEISRRQSTRAIGQLDVNQILSGGLLAMTLRSLNCRAELAAALLYYCVCSTDRYPIPASSLPQPQFRLIYPRPYPTLAKPNQERHCMICTQFEEMLSRCELC